MTCQGYWSVNGSGSGIVVYEKISKPARVVTDCQSLEDANNNLNKIGLKTELDFEREKYALLNEKD